MSSHVRIVLGFVGIVMTTIVLGFQPATAIPSEVPGLAEIVSRYFTAGNESMVLRSHAAGSFESSTFCSGAWIGPTLFITAAHCGDVRNLQTYSVQMRLYSADSPDDELYPSQFRRYWCTRQVATAFFVSDADLSIFECGTDEAVKPGDQFGWVNYSLLTYDNVGDPVYSIWMNRVDDEPTWGPERTKLYSPGRIMSKDGTAWPAPSCLHGVDSHTVSSSVYGAPGASGSVQLSTVTHSVVVGPMSTAPIAGGPSRNASSMVSMLNVRDNPPGETFMVETFLTQADRNPDRIDSMGNLIDGCQPPYTNAAETDANGNLVFDVQEAIDRHIENRPIYTLNFNTGWRQVLWSKQDAFAGWAIISDVDPWEHMAHIKTEKDEWTPALRHDKLNLKPNTTYDVRLELLPVSPLQLKVGLVHPLCPVATEERVVVLQQLPKEHSPEGHQWTTVSLHTGDCHDYALQIWVAPATNAEAPASAAEMFLQEIIVAEADAVWTFETWDEREPWTVAKTGHALMLANGEPSGGDFAGNITGMGERALHDSLVNASLPIVGRATYELAFMARKAAGTASPAYVRVSSPSRAAAGEEPVLFAAVEAIDEWRTFTYTFATGDADDYILAFGLSGEGQVVVDNVAVRRLP